MSREKRNARSSMKPVPKERWGEDSVRHRRNVLRKPEGTHNFEKVTMYR